VKLFMNDRSSNYFPLFIQSIRFFDHHDRMIRTAVRTITLSIFKLYPTNEGLAKFLLENTGGYFSLLASQLRDLWLLIDRTLEDLKVVPVASIESGLSAIIDELIDQLEYIADIERLDVPIKLTNLLHDQLKLYAIDQVLIPSLIGPGSDLDQSPESPRLSLKTAYFVSSFFVDIFGSLEFVNEIFYSKILSSSPFKSQIVSTLKNGETPTFMCLIVFLSSLANQVGSLGKLDSWQHFGLVPPNSIELSLLLAQSLTRSVDKLNLVSVWLVVSFLQNSIYSISDLDFVRPVQITVADSFRSVASRVVTIMNNSVMSTLPKLTMATSTNPDLDYSLIDDFESILLEFVVPKKIICDQFIHSPKLLMLSEERDSEWTVPADVIDGKTIFRKFFTLAVLDKKNQESLEKVFVDIFVTHSLGEDDDVTEGSTLDLSSKDRILCTHISSNRSTRYLIMDPSRLLLVTPDLKKPGFAVVKFAALLRSIKSLSIDKQDDRVLKLATSSSEIALGFEDAKRCYVALTHLETHRVEIRKTIFSKVRKYIVEFTK
jgi:hypothetical protein